MNAPRRAATHGASHPSAGVIRLGLSLTGLAAASLATATGAIALRMARRVVTPAGRLPDVRMISVDPAAQTVRLARTADTALPGRYGLFTTGTLDYVRVGSVVGEDDTTVTRKLLTEVPATATLAPDAAFSGWYFDEPAQLQLTFRDETVNAPSGPCPAWVFPAADDTDVWVIQIHGRGTTRAETLRAVPVFHDLGVNSLVVSYRNDGEAPRSRTGTYALGATEWRDIDAAIAFARRAGARRVLLMGWSMGGAIALQASLSSSHRDVIAGLVLESPVVDWRTVLDFHARALRLPPLVGALAQRLISSDWSARFVRTGAAVPLDRLDVVSRAAELRHPILLLHSDDDGFVPADASHRLAEARPDLVQMETFDVARHTKLWNYDEQRWTSVIRDWVRSHGWARRPEE